MSPGPKRAMHTEALSAADGVMPDPKCTYSFIFIIRYPNGIFNGNSYNQQVAHDKIKFWERGWRKSAGAAGGTFDDGDWAVRL